MGLTIGNSGNSINQESQKIEELCIKEDKPNTIFNVEDMDVNGDGKIDNNDFKQWTFLSKFGDLSQAALNKFLKMYLDYAVKQPYNRRDVGDLTVVEFDVPFSFGATNRKQIILDRETGETLVDKSVKIRNDKEGITSVEINTKRYGKNKVKEYNVEFQYDKGALENYVINEATDKYGNNITYFDSIPEIRNIPENERTANQKRLLNEFDSMIKSAVNAGIDYGVDPKLILSIIQEEVGFQGLSEKVTGKNGKGYMQITSSPVNDYLGLAGDKRYHEIKDFLYGPEAEELLASRGFNPKNAVTQTARKALYQNIYYYLKDNKDPDFNIRLGTIIMRYYLDKADGNVELAAKRYNGSSIKEEYAERVNKYNTILQDTVPNDTIYNYKLYQRFPKQ